jgi:dTDP-4-dehydrorhamnose 3,5-epimerase
VGSFVSDVQQLGIAGVSLAPVHLHRDDRGSFAESYRREWFADATMVQANISRSGPRVLRGLHFHLEQTDYWFLTQGRVMAGLHDLRAGSPTQGTGLTVPLDEATPAGLYIPPGVAHGFYTEGGCTLTYLVDAVFTGEDEHGVAWNDPGLGISWPDPDPVLSERDRANPFLAELTDARPTYRP